MEALLLPSSRMVRKLILVQGAWHTPGEVDPINLHTLWGPAITLQPENSFSYLEKTLICYFLLNTPTPIISVILCNNRPYPNETCIMRR